MSVYKPFSPQDYAVVPFNAHKQYNFNSSSAASNSITYYASSYTSNSIDLYNSGNIKYQQIDHLYYKNYITDINNKFGDKNYLKHKRALYKKANILSIPAGLYGHKIKPGSFILSSSFKELVDDSYGNLIISGTNVNNYCTDPRSILLDIGPVKGFKKYDLNIYDGYVPSTRYYRKGQIRANSIDSYTTPFDKYEYDDSYFLNQTYYKNVNFSENMLYNSQSKFPGIDFNGTDSEIKIYHNDTFNFNQDNDFSIEFWVKACNLGFNEEMYLIGKSTTKTIVKSPLEGTSGIYSLSYTGSSQPQDVNAKSSYPFNIFISRGENPNPYGGISFDSEAQNYHINFSRSDENSQTTIAATLYPDKQSHIVCRYSASKMCIFVDGVKTPDQLTKTSICQNNANIYIGNKGGISNFFSGSLSQIKIYNKPLNGAQIHNHRLNSNGSPYIGNVFYSNGLVTITHPKYQDVLTEIGFGIGSMTIDDEDEVINLFTVGGTETTDYTLENIFGISRLAFQGSHLIYENEYKCTIDEHEYNTTLNPTIRKLKSSQHPDIADFATGSLFKPYITTVGLYNDNNELLVVGKLGQPIRTSNETDTTIVLRWDT